MEISLHTIIKLSLLSILLSCKSTIPTSLQYIDKNKPSLESKIFAENFISKKSTSEFGSVFNKQGSEFFFAIDSAGHAKILYTKIEGDTWIEPKTIIEHESYSFNDPFLSVHENKLYYISDKQRNKKDSISDYDIWYSERIDTGWSDPINAGPVINTEANEYYISFTTNGSMYFSSNKGKSEERQRDFDIYKSVYENEKFIEPIKLGDSINTLRYEADVFVAPDESYIIFCAARREGFGNGDLYISFKTQDGIWTKSVNMGPTINSEHHELCPFVTNDGKFLFYTSNQDIYWVSAAIIDKFRN